MKTVSVATFHDRAPAQALCQELRNAGVQALIHDESKLERFSFMSEPLAAVHVEVPQPDYLTTRQMLSSGERTGPLMQAAVRCPDCGSSRIEFPQISRKFFMPVVETLFMALHLVPREFYCEDCHYTWPKVQPVEPELDILNWPIHSHMGDPRTARPAKPAPMRQSEP